MTDTTTPSFETDIKPLFRERDRGAMLRAFDLWSYEDVKANADRILAAVRSGSMPCDGRWPEEQVDLLQRWVDGDKPAGDGLPGAERGGVRPCTFRSPPWLRRSRYSRQSVSELDSDRDRHRRDRHALREPALHGRDRRARAARCGRLRLDVSRGSQSPSGTPPRHSAAREIAPAFGWSPVNDA